MLSTTHWKLMEKVADGALRQYDLKVGLNQTLQVTVPTSGLGRTHRRLDIAPHGFGVMVEVCDKDANSGIASWFIAANETIQASDMCLTRLVKSPVFGKIAPCSGSSQTLASWLSGRPNGEVQVC